MKDSFETWYAVKRIGSKMKDSFETWYAVKHILKNLKIFGCLCFSYIPQVKRHKLDKRADLEIFIGYSLFCKAYKIFPPQTNKILVRRDAKFLEDEQWEWNEESRVKTIIQNLI